MTIRICYFSFVTYHGLCNYQRSILCMNMNKNFNSDRFHFNNWLCLRISVLTTKLSDKWMLYIAIHMKYSCKTLWFFNVIDCLFTRRITRSQSLEFYSTHFMQNMIRYSLLQLDTIG